MQPHHLDAQFVVEQRRNDDEQAAADHRLARPRLDEQVPGRKSSRSNGDNGACVELACGPAVRAVRDSKNTAGPAMLFDVHELNGFLATIKAGHFEL